VPDVAIDLRAPARSTASPSAGRQRFTSGLITTILKTLAAFSTILKEFAARATIPIEKAALCFYFDGWKR
jgi:hypothetical protein